MFSYQNVFVFFKKILNKYNKDYKYFFEEATHSSSKDYIFNQSLSVFQLTRLCYFTIRLLIFKNVYHALKYKYFFSMKLKVNRNVLVPRFETELLLEKLNKHLLEIPDIQSIIDLGTGSGAIAIYLKKQFPKVNVSALDLSKKTLKVAKYNALNNNVTINFINNSFKNSNLDNYQIVISNPPYIGYSESVDTEVLKTEPHLALFAEDEGLLYYKQIINNCTYHTKLIAFEIGEKQANEVKQIILRKFKKAEVIIDQDFNGCDRFIFAKLKR